MMSGAASGWKNVGGRREALLGIELAQGPVERAGPFRYRESAVERADRVEQGGVRVAGVAEFKQEFHRGVVDIGDGRVGYFQAGCGIGQFSIRSAAGQGGGYPGCGDESTRAGIPRMGARRR